MLSSAEKFGGEFDAVLGAKEVATAVCATEMGAAVLLSAEEFGGESATVLGAEEVATAVLTKRKFKNVVLIS